MPKAVKKNTAESTVRAYAKNWVFTINNPKEKLPLWPDMLFRCYQKERGHVAGTEHFQGMVMFSKRVYLTSLKKIDNTAHWEIMRGTPEQARAYCQKADTRVEGPWEDGCPWDDVKEKRQGERNDINGAIEAYKEGGRLQACEEYPTVMVKFSRGIEYVCAAFEKPHVRAAPKNLIFWGIPNSGKTYLATHQFGDYYVAPKCSSGNLWFNGYHGQQTLIFDEFGKGNYPLTVMNTLLDKDCPQIEVKNGFAWGRWDNVIILSNDDPAGWYTGPNISKPQRDAFFSRITDIVEFKTTYSNSWRSADKTSYTYYENYKWTDVQGNPTHPKWLTIQHIASQQTSVSKSTADTEDTNFTSQSPESTDTSFITRRRNFSEPLMSLQGEMKPSTEVTKGNTVPWSLLPVSNFEEASEEQESINLDKNDDEI